MQVYLPQVSSTNKGLTVCRFSCLELALLIKVLQCAGLVASSPSTQYAVYC